MPMFSTVPSYYLMICIHNVDPFCILEPYKNKSYFMRNHFNMTIEAFLCRVPEQYSVFFVAQKTWFISLIYLSFFPHAMEAKLCEVAFQGTFKLWGFLALKN